MPFSNVKSIGCNGIELALLEGFSGRDNGTQAPPSGQSWDDLATQTAVLQSKEDYSCIISGQKCAVPKEFHEVISRAVLIDSVSYPYTQM